MHHFCLFLAQFFFFQKAVIQRLIKIFPWNQLQIATNVLNFQWKKAETIYLNPFYSYSNLKSGLNLSIRLDPFQEILVQSNKAVLESGQIICLPVQRGSLSISGFESACKTSFGPRWMRGTSCGISPCRSCSSFSLTTAIGTGFLDWWQRQTSGPNLQTSGL